MSEVVGETPLALAARLKQAHSSRSARVAGDKTISEGAPFDVNDERVDPEEQETVLFGQRSLFRDVEIAVGAKRQAEARSQRSRRVRDDRSEAQDTVVGATPGEERHETSRHESERGGARGSDGRTSRSAQAYGDNWRETVEVEAQTIEITAREKPVVIDEALGEREGPNRPAPAADPQGSSAIEPQGRRGASEAQNIDDTDIHDTVVVKGGQSAKSDPSSKAERRVAERRPAETHGERRRAHLEDACSCRMCGRGVIWPKARRFRGRKKARHGFRCDTCGNVFCAEHVVRASRFWESLLHHGRFRCLLCELGNMAKQAQERHANSYPSD